MNSVTISIPAYNDVKTIEGVIWESNTVLSNLTDHYQIFVINDGSKDDTAKVLEKLSEENSKIKVYQHPKNLGFGPTIKEVYTLPESEWVFFVPGDGQIPPSEILKLYLSIDKYDFILGYRKNRNDSWHRKLNSWCYNWFISIIAGKRVRDVNSAALVKRSLIKDIPFNSQSAFIHAEIFLKAIQRGISFNEVEIEHQPRKYGKGAGGKWKVIFSTVKDLIRYLIGRL